ncbi:MAG: hypothetical protein ABIH46_12230 [Chloroflexota bacterium]
MDPSTTDLTPAIVAALTGAVPGLTALLLVVFKGGAAIAKLEKLWGQTQIIEQMRIDLATVINRVDTIWRLTIEDGIREQRRRGDIIQTSPMRPSVEYMERIPERDERVGQLLRLIAESHSEKLPPNDTLATEVVSVLGWQKIVDRSAAIPDITPTHYIAQCIATIHNRHREIIEGDSP